MERDVFFQLVDKVLVDVGRAPLAPDGPQRAIIDIRDDDRVLQILAGPGSGKTEMLVWRVLFELFVRETPAKRVMVTTFTRRAATELSVRIVERADGLLHRAREAGLEVHDPHVHDLRIGTVHALCDSLLAEFDPGYMEQGLQLVDEFEVNVRMNREGYFVFGLGKNDPLGADILHEEFVTSLFRAPWERENYPATTPDKVSVISRLLAQHTETWEPRCAATGRANGIEARHGVDGLTTRLGDLQARWLEYLEKHHLLDFTTIQRLFHQRQDLVLGQLDHVFVDEFQDTNPIQFAIHTRWLTNPEIRLTVVGDDDQSMYRFRGSDIGCFKGLEPAARDARAAYRMAKLEENWRSTSTIVRFCEGFRGASVLKQESMEKAVRPSPIAKPGDGVRLLTGNWKVLGERVAGELKQLVAASHGKVPFSDQTVAVLMFSTSEKSKTSPASELRSKLEAAGLRVYNPSNKTAAEAGSPIQELFALISYLIDPVTKGPAGKSGSMVEVWASHRDEEYAKWSPTARPDTWVSDGHASIQKRFRKSNRPGAQDLLAYIDEIRERLVATPDARLTLSGLVSRMLSFEYFRGAGFSQRLFREAQFTDILDASIGATRRSRDTMDAPLRPTRDADGKVVWPTGCWRFLSLVGMLLEEARLDDKDVEAFQEGAVSLLTFHQAKGLEFDHVYVAMTGREPNPNNVLLTRLFSGDPVEYMVGAGQAMTTDNGVNVMAEADREREVYVGLTRAQRRLTILHDPATTYPNMALNPSIETVFASTLPPTKTGDISERTFH